MRQGKEERKDESGNMSLEMKAVRPTAQWLRQAGQGLFRETHGYPHCKEDKNLLSSAMHVFRMHSATCTQTKPASMLLRS